MLWYTHASYRQSASALRLNQRWHTPYTARGQSPTSASRGTGRENVMMIASKDVEVDDRVKAVMEAELSEKNEDPSQKGEHHVIMINHERSSRWLEADPSFKVPHSACREGLACGSGLGGSRFPRFTTTNLWKSARLSFQASVCRVLSRPAIVCLAYCRSAVSTDVSAAHNTPCHVEVLKHWGGLA